MLHIKPVLSTLYVHSSAAAWVGVRLPVMVVMLLESTLNLLRFLSVHSIFRCHLAHLHNALIL